MTQGLNILVACPELPRPDMAAGDRRFFALLKIMAQRHRVTLCASDSDSLPPEAVPFRQELQDAGVRVLAGGLGDFHRTTQRHVYHLIIVEFWAYAERWMSVLRKRQPWASIFVDSVDIHFVREEGGLPFGSSDPHTVAGNKQREINIYRRADAVIVVTPEDDRVLEAVGGIPRRFLIPLILTPSVRAPMRRGQDVVFVGGFRHAPNMDAVVWFAQDIWPAVRAAVPDAHWTVVGSSPPPAVQSLNGQNNITVTGYVPDTAPYLEKAMVSVAPLRYGAGMKGKVSEAMMAGLAVVTTSFGVQGLHVSGQQALVADTAHDFAQHVIALLLRPEQAERVGRAGQEHIAAICGPSAVDAQLDAMLQTVSSKTANPPFVWKIKAVFNYMRGFIVLVLKSIGIRKSTFATKRRTA